MPRKQSDATALRAEKRENAILRKRYYEAEQERVQFKRQADKYYNEVVEWKARFDKLLERTPVAPKNEL